MEQNWKTTLSNNLNLLGHRNWIVVTDMAYPLQSNPGVTTLFANEDFAKVVERTLRMIEEAPHVRAHIYVDEEQHAMSDRLCDGWSAYQHSLADAVGNNEINYLPHEELIHRLDTVRLHLQRHHHQNPAHNPLHLRIPRTRLRLLGRRPRKRNPQVIATVLQL